MRHVIVITGKGHSSPPDYIYGDAHREKGVLRRNLPIWLTAPELKSHIVAFENAPTHQGGQGAYYVHIRKAKAL